MEDTKPCNCKSIDFKFKNEKRINMRGLRYKERNDISVYTTSLSNNHCFFTIFINLNKYVYRHGKREDGISTIESPINCIDEDILCEHGNVFFTVEQLFDLETILYINSAAVFKYLLQIGFKLTEEWIENDL